MCKKSALTHQSSCKHEIRSQHFLPQIRSHAQKFFLKLEKDGQEQVIPPPRPKKRPVRPYSHKQPDDGGGPGSSRSLSAIHSARQRDTPETPECSLSGGSSDAGTLYSPYLKNAETGAIEQSVCPSVTPNRFDVNYKTMASRSPPFLFHSPALISPQMIHNYSLVSSLYQSLQLGTFRKLPHIDSELAAELGLLSDGASAAEAALPVRKTRSMHQVPGVRH